MARARKLKAVEEDYAIELGRIEEFAEELPDKYLHCRELGHNWRPFTAGSHPDGGFERVLRCTRCRCRRVQELTSRGAVVTNKYIHPEGYLSKGHGRIVGEGRDMLRLVSLKRLVGSESE
jgi:hypothetical protein